MRSAPQPDQVDFSCSSDVTESESQINVPPTRDRGLWKVIASALRCPSCNSQRHKAETGKRLNGEGLLEQYRRCECCHIRFRVVFE